MSSQPLPSIVAYGEGARLVRERGALMIYNKWLRPLSRGIKAGQLVVVEDEEGELLGCGFFDDVGPVGVRLAELGGCSSSSPWEIILSNLERALRARKAYKLVCSTCAYRLVHSDGDWLPGLIVDVYGDLAVYQSSSIVWDIHGRLVVDAIVEVTGVEAVYEKSTQRTRKDIGLKPREDLRYGSKTRTVVEEDEVKFIVDVRKAQKTGLFLDHRFNRIEFGEFSRGNVLDLFSYTGGFGLHSLVRGNADKAVFVEEDEKAVEILKENLELNKVADKAKIVVGNVWDYLRHAISKRDQYDAIAVDPPAFIPYPEAYEKGLRAYRVLYSQVTRIASPDALVFLSSCSTHLSHEGFIRVVAEALTRAKRRYTVLGGLRGMPPDHPVRPSSPHLNYLKALFIYIH